MHAGRNSASGAGDCLMVLESVQVDIDPSSLMLPERVMDEEVTELLDDDDEEEPSKPPP